MLSNHVNITLFIYVFYICFYLLLLICYIALLFHISFLMKISSTFFFVILIRESFQSFLFGFFHALSLWFFQRFSLSAFLNLLLFSLLVLTNKVPTFESIALRVYLWRQVVCGCTLSIVSATTFFQSQRTFHSFLPSSVRSLSAVIVTVSLGFIIFSLFTNFVGFLSNPVLLL